MREYVRRAGTEWLSRGLLTMLITFAGAAIAAPDTTSPARSGAWVYGTKCAACHTGGFRGAPKISDKKAWAPRLLQGRDKLYERTLKGTGWMPRRGGCSACSDAEVAAALDHMLSLVR